MTAKIIGFDEQNQRVSTQQLLQKIYAELENGQTEFEILSSGHHDIGGPLWTQDGSPLKFRVKYPGQRVGSFALDGTEIVVEGSAPADAGRLCAGGEVTILGDGGDPTAHCAASGKIYVGGRVGTRSGSLMKHDPAFEPPQFWVLKSTGSFSFDFMGSGIAVVCGHGCDELESILGDRACAGMVRLRWLDSRIALDDDVVSPFLPIQVKESEFEFLGRMIRINETGFAERIVSRFSQEMTGFNDSRDILASPVRLVIEDNTGNCIPWNLQKKAQIVYQTPGMVRWNSTGNAKTLMINLNAELEADGNLEYTIKIHSDSPVRLGDIRLEVPYRRDVARYMLGLGFRGGYRPSEFNWKWDVQRLNQDSIWLGDVNAGLQITLKDENYSRPLNTNFYTLKPLVSPASWDNGGKGGIRLIDNPEWDSLQVCCYSGPRQMQPGDRPAEARGH